MKIHNNLTVILISYKSEKKIQDFVKKIPKKIKVIIIENSKNIILKKKIEKKYKNIKVFIKKNNGVSASINYAVKKIKTKYFLQISPDIQFNFKQLNIFFKIAKELNDKFSALGPRFINVKAKSHKQIKNNLNIGPINSIHGSFMFINKKRFQDIKGFDENFFLYFEETDYCKRALSIGLKAYQINKIKVKTLGRTVTIKNKKEKNDLTNLLLWHFIWSKYYFTKKNYGNIVTIILFTPILIRSFFKVTYYKLTNNKEFLEKYKYRLSGLITSIRGKSSDLRI
jgi:GT2 family glycosyltransferase